MITGEGRADEQTLSGKAAMGVARLARTRSAPVVLLTGALGHGAAALDASIYHGNQLGIDPVSVSWPRTLDVNDRELRYSVVGLGGKAHAVEAAAGEAECGKRCKQPRLGQHGASAKCGHLKSPDHDMWRDK